MLATCPTRSAVMACSSAKPCLVYSYCHPRSLASASQRLPQRRCRGFRICSATLAEAPSALDVTTMSPLGDRLLVQPDEEASTTSGGLIMSTSGTKQMHDATIGTVLAVGSEVKISVAKDDTVLFTKQGSSDVPVARDGEVCFVQERAVLAKLS